MKISDPLIRFRLGSVTVTITYSKLYHYIFCDTLRWLGDGFEMVDFRFLIKKLRIPNSLGGSIPVHPEI